MLDFLFGGVSFNPEKDIPSLADKTILVTGGNIGLGKESILQLSKHDPKEIFLAARTASKAKDAIESIKKKVPKANVTFLELDLGSLDSIKKAADEFKSKSQRLDVLMNNAGIMACPPGLTASGYEIQFGTNHIGHALFTKLLMPTLRRTASEPGADVRIINLSSMGHRFAPSGGLVLDEAQTPMAAYSTWRRYGQSKLANVLFNHELAKRYPEIRSIVIHPGTVNTNLSNGLLQFSSVWEIPSKILSPLITSPVSVGALNQLWAATSQDAKAGTFYNPVGKVTNGSGYAQDKALAKELWDWTERELEKNGYGGAW